MPARRLFSAYMRTVPGGCTLHRTVILIVGLARRAGFYFSDAHMHGHDGMSVLISVLDEIKSLTAVLANPLRFFFLHYVVLWLKRVVSDFLSTT